MLLVRVLPSVPDTTPLLFASVVLLPSGQTPEICHPRQNAVNIPILRRLSRPVIVCMSFSNAQRLYTHQREQTNKMAREGESHSLNHPPEVWGSLSESVHTSSLTLLPHFPPTTPPPCLWFLSMSQWIICEWGFPVEIQSPLPFQGFPCWFPGFL